MELIYDFASGGNADGWLHGLFRYELKANGHAAETSFGAHIFNTVLTYRNEPQSYAGRAPGLSTRLFLRLGLDPLDTLCHLVYPASTSWHGYSSTELALHDATGKEVARRQIAIPCGGSLLWRYRERFDAAARARAGEGAYVIVRDTTCRLFGYHGLIDDQDRFSLDHMFGFYAAPTMSANAMELRALGGSGRDWPGRWPAALAGARLVTAILPALVCD